jgi:hypothetical protein
LHWELAFDAGHRMGIEWSMPMAALPLFCGSATALWLARRRRTGGAEASRRKPSEGVLRALIAFASAWMVLAAGDVWFQHARAVDDLRAGQYSVIEGDVRRFVPMPWGGHALESFDVGDRHFSYSDFVATPGFRRTASHGGPIREGLHVRIAYVGNVILRLEILR